MSVASKHRFICQVTLQYGVQYHKCAVSARPPNEWPDDLHVPFTDWMDFVCSMPISVRSAIGLNALAHMSAPNILAAKTWAFAHSQLKEEVMDGRSTVILNSSGQAERVVFVTALHITEGDGNRFLAQIAKWDAQFGAPIRAIVELPGSTQQFMEAPFDAARRILKTKFQVDDAVGKVHDLKREVSYKESQGYKVHTKSKWSASWRRTNSDLESRTSSVASADAEPVRSTPTLGWVTSK